jgi:hypothetical protein
MLGYKFIEDIGEKEHWSDIIFIPVLLQCLPSPPPHSPSCPSQKFTKISTPSKNAKLYFVANL